MAVVVVEAGARVDALSPGALERAGRQDGPGNFLGAVHAVGVACNAVHARQAVQRERQREQELDVAAAATAAFQGHRGLAARQQHAGR